MQFKDFKRAIQKRFYEMCQTGPIYRALVDKFELWNTYIESFPEGSNLVYRNRREYDCSACRHFIKDAGSMVQIVNGKLTTLWDIEIGGIYQPVVDALSAYVKSIGIDNVFLHSEANIGVDANREFADISTSPRSTITWEHFSIILPAKLHCKNQDIGPRLSEYQAMHDVVFRSLKEITPSAIETVQDLIAQNSLYRGAEKKKLVDTFATMKRGFDTLTNDEERDLFAWSAVTNKDTDWVCKIRNDVVGTLLVDLSDGVDLESAVKSFEDKVSGTNYKRPTALVTPKMRDAAREAIKELGLMSALDRRYARLEDISITDILFADRSTKSRISGDVFDDIPTKGQDSKKLDKVEEIPIEKFISDVLPTAKSLEILLENRHSGNLVSLIAPCDFSARPLFKWKNPFSWSYSGDVADSIKEKVKAAGGSVVGDVCCRLAWYNYDDLDLHMQEPGGCRIYFSRKGPSPSGGRLDVDMNAGGGSTRTPVENIFYPDYRKMAPGVYKLSVNQYSKRESTDVGFDVEIDILGELHSFSYAKAVISKEYVDIAELHVSGKGIEIKPLLKSTQPQKELWGLKTQDFQPVSAIMLSPNYWSGEGVGNKHYFFMLNKCKNEGSARGFYNEFLSSELEPHRKTMELVGSKTRTEESEDQMSGLGFSSTQRNSVIVRIHGSFTRVLKVAF